MRFRSLLPVILALGAISSFSHAAGTDPSADDDFDRLDGVGKSGKTVQVIDWEGNMEIHVYPKGSLKGLALKIDRKDKSKPVMVIGYRFADNPKVQLIRRALLTMPLTEGFKAYNDKSEPEFDKVIISNNGLADLALFKLDPEPKQLYPDGHPALAESAKKEDRNPAGKAQRAGQVPQEKSQDTSTVDEDGRITPFGMGK
jgi:hypothetical protein